MNYVRFLKYYAPHTESINLFDQSDRSPLQTIEENSPRTGSDRLVLTQVCIKLRRKVKLIENFDMKYFHRLFSYLIRINNYDEHLNKKIKQIVDLYLWKHLNKFLININVLWMRKNFIHYHHKLIPNWMEQLIIIIFFNNISNTFSFFFFFLFINIYPN